MPKHEAYRTMSGRVIRPRELSASQRIALLRRILAQADDDVVRKSIEAVIRRIQREQGVAIAG